MSRVDVQCRGGGAQSALIDRNHVANRRELEFRFVLWFRQLRLHAHEGPIAPLVMRARAHFGVSRATAYRWIRGYFSAAQGESDQASHPGSRDRHFEFAIWAAAQPTLPLMESVKCRCRVTRATAYRLLADFRSAAALTN